MNILIVYYTLTGNTARIAQAIHEAVLSREHKVTLSAIDGVTADSLTDYDLVYLGSSCHDTDLARPVKRLLEEIKDIPLFKLAGFVTHATRMPEDGERARELYEQWAGNCIRTFHRIRDEKHITFLGYFHCQGAASPPIEAFIHNTIITNENDWATYSVDMRGHPDETDLQKAKAFARQVLYECSGN